MRKNKVYKYVGKNGYVHTPVLLNGVEHYDMYELFADEGMMLTNGTKNYYSVLIDAEDLDKWTEVPLKAESI